MSVDGADLFEYDTKEGKVNTRNLTMYALDKDGKTITTTDKSGKEVKVIDSNKFKIRFDTSMGLDELTEILEKKRIKKQSIFKVKWQDATNQVIHVTFKYSVKAPHTITKGKNKGKIKNDSVEGYNRKGIRKKIYKDGFHMDNIHYVRWERSGGSARTGKCLFINENLLKLMNEFTDCGVDTSKPLDLASFEAYRALILSGKIGDIEIRPENILLIEDCKSTFENDVMLTSYDSKHNKLFTKEQRVEITNKIHDGQSLIDISLMPEGYKEKGMILLRHKFFKSCCFNSNIQQWFIDNKITDISQLKGKTVATKIEDIKLITTPSSIKYIKFGDKDTWFTDWIEQVEKSKKPFGIVKYEKPTKYFNGDLVRTHYQILNTLQIMRDKIKVLSQETLDYLDLLRKDHIAMMTYCMIHADDEDSELMLNTHCDIIYRMMKENEDFHKTEYYRDTAKNIIEQLRSDVKIGRILVRGNYSTILGNPIEMLQASIGIWDGTSQVGEGNIVTKVFPEKELLVCRSPHICAGNIYLPKNTKNELIEKYINMTDNIVVINSIGENTLQRLSGCDMDSDQILITDNQIMIDAARSNYDKFKVPTTDIEPSQDPKAYTPENLAELDHKTSVNLIGEIVNLSQVLNSIYWHIDNTRHLYEDESKVNEYLEKIYTDICQLSIMSGIEIDKAKKDFGNLDNNKELNRIRDKYRNKKTGKLEYPMFFRELSRKGRYNSKRVYVEYETTVDMLADEIRNCQLPVEKESDTTNWISLDKIFNKDKTKSRDIDNEKIAAIKEICNERIKADTELGKLKEISEAEEYLKRRKEIIRDFMKQMEQYKNLDRATLNELLKTIEEKGNRYLLEALLTIECKNLMRIIRTSNTTPIYIRNENGEVEMYGIKFIKKVA